MNVLRRRRGGVTRLGNAAHFAGSPAQWAAITDAAQTGLDPGVSDFSFAFWVNPESTAAINSLVGKGASADAAATAPGYWCFYNTNKKLSFLFSDNATSTRLNFATTQIVPTFAWSHIVASFTRASTLQVWINGVPETPFTISTRAGSMTPSADFALASLSVNGVHAAGSLPLSGRLDMTGFWLRALTTVDMTALFNNGAGRLYSELATDQKVSLSSWWEFENTWNDSAGPNGLTPSGSPTFAVGAR